MGSGPGSSPLTLPDACHGWDFAYISSQTHWDQSLLLPIYLGLYSCGNKSFFQSSFYLTLQECVCGGGAYINALFLTCLACFKLAINECAENKGLWLLWSLTAHRVGFLSITKSYFGLLAASPFLSSGVCEDSCVCDIGSSMHILLCFDMILS